MSDTIHTIKYKKTTKVYHDGRSYDDYNIVETEACEDFFNLKEGRYGMYLQVDVDETPGKPLARIESGGDGSMIIRFCPFCGAGILFAEVEHKIMKQMPIIRTINDFTWV